MTNSEKYRKIYKLSPIKHIISKYFIILTICLISIAIYESISKDTTLFPSRRVVFLIRTFPGHFDLEKPFNLLRMLLSLQSLEETNWIAYIVNTDVKSLPSRDNAVFSIIENDKRIQILDINVYKPYDKWIAGYDITDEALDRLSKLEIPWIVITNGDNWYHSKFLNSLNSPVISNYDMIISNYWSRYNRADIHDYPEQNPLNMSATVCHRVYLDLGYIDLGGVILSLRRIQKDKIRFMRYGEINSQDGCLFNDLKYKGWRIKHVDECLFSHSPNPYSCSAFGGIWWNSPSSLEELGESCFSKNTANQFLLTHYPKPILEVSNTNIKYLSLPEPFKSIRFNNLQKEFVEFGIETVKRRKVYRNEICQALKKTEWKPDLLGYAQFNPDLKTANVSSDNDLLEHFWVNGCEEQRPIPNPPMLYFLCRADESDIKKGYIRA